MAHRRALAVVAALVLALSAVAQPATAATFRVVDAEGASISGGVLTDNGRTFKLFVGSQGHAPAIVTSPVHTGSHSVRSRLAPDTDGKHDRSEIEVSNGIGNTWERYLRFWVFVPKGFTDNSNGRQLFMQLHPSPSSSGVGHGPPLALYFTPNSNLEYDVVIREDADKGVFPTDQFVRHTDAFPKGQWVKFVVGWRGAPNTSGGWVKIWRGGSLRYTFDGAWNYAGLENSVKVGLYGSANKTGTTQTVFIDDIRYGDSYADVN